MVRFNYKGDQIATGGEDGVVRIWNVPAKLAKIRETMSLKGHTDYINSIDYDKTDRMVGNIHAYTEDLGIDRRCTDRLIG